MGVQARERAGRALPGLLQEALRAIENDPRGDCPS